MNGPNIIINPLLVGFVFVTNNYLREIYEVKKKKKCKDLYAWS